MNDSLPGPGVPAANSLRATRTVAASRDRTFRAWTDPAALTKWFRVANGYTTPIAEVDLRVGGRYRLGMQPPGESPPQIVSGVYREVRPPERLVFTWRWEGSGEAEPETLVTVEFYERGDVTEVVLTHAQFAFAEARDRHADGWQGCLDALAASILEKEI